MELLMIISQMISTGVLFNLRNTQHPLLLTGILSSQINKKRFPQLKESYFVTSENIHFHELHV